MYVFHYVWTLDDIVNDDYNLSCDENQKRAESTYSTRHMCLPHVGRIQAAWTLPTCGRYVDLCEFNPMELISSEMWMMMTSGMLARLLC